MRLKAICPRVPVGMTKTLRVMKITALILLMAGLTASAAGYSQKVTLSEKNAPLEKLFTQIKQQTGYLFFYNYDLLKDARPVTISVKEAPLNEVLKLCFKDQPLDYVIENNTISITRKPASAATSLNTPDALPPPIDIKGRVVNENGEPVVATIQVKGDHTKGTTTNEQGYFELKGVDENATLVISGVSIELFEVKVGGKKDLATLSAKTKISEGETVVVNTGYQQLKPNEVTGSVVIVGKDQLDQRVATDILSKLEGITSGLAYNVDVNGKRNLAIRGRSTILANAAPLVIVDNFPYDGDINNINPNDVENITVLKDAAAASIWGAFAGNGVIVITTKKGKLNQPFRIDLNTNVTTGSKPDLFYNRSFLSSPDFIDVENYLFTRGFYDADITNTSTRPPVSPVVEILARQRSGQITQQEADMQISRLKDIDIRNELERYYYRNLVNQQTYLTLTGGGIKTGYLLSLGYDKNLSSLKGNENRRTTINSLATFAPVKNLELTAGINYVQSSSAANSTLDDIRTGGSGSRDIYPYAQFTDDSGNPIPIVKNFRSGFLDTVGNGRLQDWRYYPLYEQKIADNKSKLYDTRFTAGLRYTIIKGLSAELRYQYQMGRSDIRSYYSPETYFVRDLVNRYADISSGTARWNIPLGGILDLTENQFTSNNGRAQLNFNKRFKQNSIVAAAGIDIKEIERITDMTRFYGYNDDVWSHATVRYDSSYRQIPSGSRAAIPNPNKLGSTINRFRSYFGNVSYTLNDKYTFSASGRIDQANLFGVKANQRSVPLWSGGIKWDLDKEDFYKVKWLSLLQLRVTYGYNGNLLLDGTAYTTASFNNVSNNVRGPYASIVSPGNPELTWERIGMTNVGLYFSTVKSLFSGSIEYFYKKGRNMIGTEPVPSSTGFTNGTGNFSDMSGRGIDINISSKIFTGTFGWTSTILFSYATDKVTKYNGTSLVLPILEGRPVQGVYAYRWAGLDPVTGDPMGYLSDTSKIPSKDYAVFSTQSLAAKRFIGNANPVFFGGFQNVFSFRNFTLITNFSFKAGYYFVNKSINYSSLYTNWRGHADFQQRWQKPGDEAFTHVPSMTYPLNGPRDNFYAGSDVLAERGDHIRFKDIRLNYDFNKKLAQKTVFASVQLYIYINNIGIIWKANKSGIDPDYQIGYPAVRTISVGAKLSLQ